MNSAATVPDAPTVATPEQAMSFGDWRAQSQYKGFVDPDSFFGKLANFFDGSGDKARRDYQTYLDNLNNRNEAKATQSARAWDEYMSNTAYSRGFKDLESYGVNPYMLLNSGSTPSTSVGSASKPSYSVSKPGLKDSKGGNAGRDLALLLLAIARIAATVG